MSDPRVLALPAEFVFEGRTLLVSPRLFSHEAAFCVWMERQALLGIQRHRDTYSELEYQQQLAGFRQDCAAKVYQYPMPQCMQGVFTPAGMKYMLYLALKEKQPDVTEALVERIFADDAKWEELRTIYRGLNDPNSGKPAQGQEAAPAIATPS